MRDAPTCVCGDAHAGVTPNYDDAHRNHFHLDIGQSGPASGFSVRGYGFPDVDVSAHGDE